MKLNTSDINTVDKILYKSPHEYRDCISGLIKFTTVRMQLDRDELLKSAALSREVLQE